MLGNLKNIISITDFSREDFVLVFDTASKLEKLSRGEKSKLLSDKLVASLFFEPSTRTRLSFETAIQNLGGKVIGFSDSSNTSTKKGESLEDTIKVISDYADTIVLRHPINGSAKIASEVSSKPIINAGDGTNEHPTQTLLDLYTIQKEFGRLDNLNIGLLGDLKYGRTSHSLLYALSLFDNIGVYLYNPSELSMPPEVIQKIKGKLEIVQNLSLDETIPELDILYTTRIQAERFSSEDYGKISASYFLKKETILKGKSSLKIMHPLPRVKEIPGEIDSLPNAIYFKQTANGVPVRESLLCLLNDVFP